MDDGGVYTVTLVTQGVVVNSSWSAVSARGWIFVRGGISLPGEARYSYNFLESRISLLTMTCKIEMSSASNHHHETDDEMEDNDILPAFADLDQNLATKGVLSPEDIKAEFHGRLAGSYFMFRASQNCRLVSTCANYILPDDNKT